MKSGLFSLFLCFSLFGLKLNAQNSDDVSAEKKTIEGTYQIEIPNIKYTSFEIHKDSLYRIEQNRLQNDINSIQIQGYQVLIMPLSMINQGVKWTTYKIIEN